MNIDFWEETTFDLLDTVTTQIEAKYGRKEPFVVENLLVFERDGMVIKEKIRSKDHIRYTLYTISIYSILAEAYIIYDVIRDWETLDKVFLCKMFC